MTLRPPQPSVWTNLIGNAVKFSAHRDAPRIGTSLRIDDGAEALEEFAETGTNVGLYWMLTNRAPE